jgi:hypothetical protein
MKSIIFWDVTPCSPLSCNRRFGGNYRLHLQGRRIISARTSRQAGSKQIIFQPENRYCKKIEVAGRLELGPPKRWLQLNGLHGVISQKMILFITTAVKTSNQTFV